MKPFEPQQLPIEEIRWDSLIPLIGRANRSLAYFDGILYGVANPNILLSPLTTQEAVLSSKMEGTLTSNAYFPPFRLRGNIRTSVPGDQRNIDRRHPPADQIRNPGEDDGAAKEMP